MQAWEMEPESENGSSYSAAETLRLTVQEPRNVSERNKSDLACLEARDVMTADEEEITQAQEEGIFVHPAQTFERITGEDHVTGVDFMNVKSFTFDENRRAIIEEEEGSEHHIDADTVIFAVGQRPDITEEAGLELGRGNSIVVKDMEKDKTTSVEGIFAAGDVIYGNKIGDHGDRVLDVRRQARSINIWAETETFPEAGSGR